MKWIWVVSASAVVLGSGAQAATFKPDILSVCDQTRSGTWVVNRGDFINNLIQVGVGVPAVTLHRGGPFTYEMAVRALMNPAEYCKANRCPKAVAPLGRAMSYLDEFLSANAGPYRDASYRVMGATSAEEYILAPEGSVTIQCFPRSEQQQADAEVKLDEGPRHYFGIRKNIDDFRYSQNDPEFKKVERASLTLKHDYEADSAAFG